jgi:hypothetical protein
LRRVGQLPALRRRRLHDLQLHWPVPALWRQREGGVNQMDKKIPPEIYEEAMHSARFVALMTIVMGVICLLGLVALIGYLLTRAG